MSVMLTSKDQLAHYMINGHLHLSKKDYGFFNNIKSIVHDNKPVTSNQNKLFDKLLTKYQRQLHKLNFNVKELTSLPWKVEVLESKQEYLDAYISIDNDIITIRSPFNNKFIQLFRKIALNEFVWDKVKRIYTAPLSTYQLRIAIDAITTCYEDVVYCDNVKSILNEVEEYNNIKYWQPTLVKINNNFYIVATNSSLNDSIKHIELNDDPKTFYLLSQYGVIVHKDLLTDKYKKFSAEYITQIDTTDLHCLSDYLYQLNVECVFTSRDLVYSKELSNDLKLSLLDKGIICKPAKELDHTNNSVLLKTNSSWTTISNLKKYDKIIHLTNSRPVKVK
jgi:hypothetical protein